MSQPKKMENTTITTIIGTNIRAYDADAEQRIGLTLKQNGKRYKVAHVLRPLADADFFKFEEKKNLVQTVSGTDILNISTTDNSLEAAGWLWDLLAVKREGYVEREDWKAKTNLIDKATAVNQGLLAVFVADESDDDPFSDEFADDISNQPFDDFNDDAISCIKLDCLFNETAITTAHHFRQPSAKDVGDYEKTMRKLTNRVNSRKGFRQKNGDQHIAHLVIPSKARELCALYDRLIERAEGYVGRVPAHHKREAVLELFSHEIELTKKN